MKGLTRRQGMMRVALGAAMVSGAGRGWSAEKTLPTTDSLPDVLQTALQVKQPLVVMVSLHGCPFCKVVRENYLVPLREKEGLHVVQIDMRDRRTIKDFAGNVQTQDELIRKWGIKIAPTVLFFGASGKEVAKRLNGAYLPDFYNSYLEEQLSAARLAVAR